MNYKNRQNQPMLIGVRGEWTGKGHTELFEMMKMFYILFKVVVTHLYTIIKIHPTKHLRYENFMNKELFL